MPTENSNLQIMVSQALVSRLVVGMSIGVLGLGAFREWYVFTFGTDTILEDLRQIALDTEHCLGSYYSSVLMIVVAAMMVIIGQSSSTAKRWRNYWRVLAALFLCFSIDEAVSFHEVLIDPLREAFGFSGYLTFAWVVPAAVFLIVFGLIYARFVFALKDPLRWQVILAGTIYVTGALGLEVLGGHFHTIGGPASLQYILTAYVEELLEITGLTILFLALLDDLRRHEGAITFVMKDRGVTAIASDLMEAPVQGAVSPRMGSWN